MSRDEVKKIFFELLTEDEEFKRKLTEFILNAVAEKFVERVAQDEPAEIPPAEPEVVTENPSDELNAQLEKLRKDKEAAETKREELQAKYDELKTKYDGLQTDYEKLNEEKLSVETKREELQTDYKELKADYDKLNAEKISVENKRDELQIERDELQSQLAERFPDGWELYTAFLEMDETTRDSAGLRKENFKSFICSGAQTRNLESVWEAALDSKRAGRFDDADFLWKVFKYCVTLVNASQRENPIEILNTQKGDRYDNDKHSTSGTNSSTQGVVLEINQLGYRNKNNNKIKKSNVLVG